MREPVVYITASHWYGTLYVGVTSNLLQRITQHKGKIHPHAFTRRYDVIKLVYYERFEDMRTAIAREKQLKAGSRRDKIDLIRGMNPYWIDLYRLIVVNGY